MSTDEGTTPFAERLDRLNLWTEQYRELLAWGGYSQTLHRLGDGPEVTVADVEWLVRVAYLAGRAAAEARGERAKFSPASFDADFPASAELARTVYTAVKPPGGSMLFPDQRSTTDQLRDLITLANRAGMYDAADFCRREVERVEARLRAIDTEENL